MQKVIKAHLINYGVAAFVDFLFHLMSLPVATIVKLLHQPNMVDCIGDLYSSIESLDSEYLLSDSTNDAVLNPKTSLAFPLLSVTGSQSNDESSKKFYMCSFRSGYSSYDEIIHKYVTDSPGQKCPSCKVCMSTEVAYVVPEGSVNIATSSKGYVKGVVSYMVMDNLEVNPMSTISGITMMNEFGIKTLSSFKEKKVDVTLNEGIAILKASLETKAVLTAVFLENKI